MNIFLTGATGYIGGSVARRLTEAGHSVRGLTRSDAKRQTLQAQGITPVAGTLQDAGLLTREAQNADAVVNAADADDVSVVQTFLSALHETGKILIQTSGSSIVGDKAAGEPSDVVHPDTEPVKPVAEKEARVAIDRAILDGARANIRSLVICPCMIYGRGLGLHKESIQVPLLWKQAQESGVVRHVGRGLNIWSNVHIADLADLYLLALTNAIPGTFYFAENGEATLHSLTQTLSDAMGKGGVTEDWPQDTAIAYWGFEPAVFALGSNSRIRSVNARELLNWQPRHNNIHEEIREEVKHTTRITTNDIPKPQRALQP